MASASPCCRLQTISKRSLPSLKRSVRLTLIKAYIVDFIANLAFQILVPAQTRIYEQAICLQWYNANEPDDIPSSGVIPEERCKLAPIQQELASLKGWYETFDAAPALLMATPLGILMGLIGRRPILLAGLGTITAQQFWIACVGLSAPKIPMQAIWLAPLLNFLSGGMVVLTMVVFLCLVTDISSRDSLATAPFRLGSIAELTKVIGPLAAGVLMQASPWWAINAGLAGLLVLMAVSLTTPETMAFEVQKGDYGNGPHQPRKEASKHVWPLIKSGVREMRIVWTDRRLIWLLCPIPCLNIGDAVSDMLQQYVSTRYDWKLADAAFVISFQGVGAAMSMFVILPMFAGFVERRFSLSPVALNMTLTRTSCLILAVAYGIEGVAPTLVVLCTGLLVETLGLGGAASLKALAASVVEQKDNGRVFSVLALCGVLSKMVGYPLGAALFNVGLEHGRGVYLGLPFFMSAVFAAIAGVALLLLRFQHPPNLE